MKGIDLGEGGDVHREAPVWEHNSEHCYCHCRSTEFQVTSTNDNLEIDVANNTLVGSRKRPKKGPALCDHWVCRFIKSQ